MKRFAIALAIIFISYFSFSQEKPVYADDYLVKIGDQAPDFTLQFRIRWLLTPVPEFSDYMP